MQSISEQIRLTGIIPVVKFDSADHAVPLAQTLMKNSLPAIEVTFRTAEAEAALQRISAAFPDMLLGAGTVLTIEQVDRAIAAGAKFIVSPGFNKTTAEYCIKKNIPIFPGCSTPSDIEQALELGLTDVKFFPAEQSGGAAMIKALSAPYPSVRFMPTGGISPHNIAQYLELPQVFACGGSWMVNNALMAAGKFDEIGQAVREAVRSTMGFMIKHVGINTENEEEAWREAKKMADLFLLPINEIPISLFVGTEFEFMKSPYYGKNGHIGIGVYSVDRVCAMLEKKGCRFRPETYKYNDKGEKTFAYLEDEIGGFAIHFVNR